MSNTKLLTVISFLFLISCNSHDKNTLVLKDANIINVYNGEVSANSVVIEDGIIKEIGAFKNLNSAKSSQVIDCSGKYLLPGFFDMHTHILEHKNSTKFLDSLLSVGITSIRDMGGHADSLARVKSEINKGIINGPDIFFAGYTLDGDKQRDTPDPTTLIINDSTDLSEVVSKLKQYKVDFIKVHSYFPYNRLEELIGIASQQDLYVVGHIPRNTDPNEAIQKGMRSIEHLNSIIEGLVTKESNGVENITQAFNTIDSTYLDSLSRSFVGYGSAFTPTLHIIDKIYSSNPDENLRRLGGLMMDRFMPMVLALHKNNVLILAGSDDVPVDNSNYAALHKELEWLVKAGLTNLESIQTATINPSKFLDIESEYGSVDIHKKANLIILNSNPLDKIENTTDISNIVVKGQLLK
ncbi:amidohydrolase family protein [Leptobacterium flavescens]|uniref:Amidohydrolase family protein n=1 Tax=Leptobacterium flavescens TaxID=472055 RepID=A0A6P0UJ89_9FLAO|nr:amidohydrolase family protein [Leptobacterium flavescens]NER13047.1 amidohydrolase family protein [Leptobacterium flavescens]